jgi:uncharacterized protein with PIN domain
MKFLSDGMLGRFSRWLRLLGYDVEYLSDVPDNRLIETAKKEKRTLLTCDLQLYRLSVAQGIEAYLVEGRTEAERLARISKRFKIKLSVDTKISRCPVCNSPIKPVNKEHLKEKIPPSVLKHYRRFWVCKGCGKVYWQGGHWARIYEILREAKRIGKTKGVN